ncbi:unnamed protein product [Arctia plantaginis]|uniref:FP protein C-terminal domain-containing protein n=1 Tax=Arctia plantaginis TaxID=874455 RepID=A0A8S0YWK6_ARCPL|nr:unnamed protein product [Arctia plantaginis]
MTSFEGMLNKQYENIQKLQQDYNAMKTEISDIKQSIDNLQHEQSNLLSNLSTQREEGVSARAIVGGLQEKLSSAKVLITRLSEQLRVREQEGRRNNLEISGIPLTSKNENLFHILHRIGVKVGFSLTATDIDYIPRVRRFSSKETLRGSEESSASQLEPVKTSTIPNIIVRDKGRRVGYKYIWLNDCKIFIRKSDTSKAIVISSENDLDKIK